MGPCIIMSLPVSISVFAHRAAASMLSSKCPLLAGPFGTREFFSSLPKEQGFTLIISDRELPGS